jgi:1,3-alpha-isomaltosidase
MTSRIRHVPAGRGHAYRPSLAQRLPIQPVEGVPIAVGALTAADLDHLEVELEVDGAHQVLEARRSPLVDASGGDTGGEAGHLAAAAAAGEDIGELVAWRADLGRYRAGTSLSYRFRSAGEVGELHRCTVAGWRSGGRLDLVGDGRHRAVPSSVASLVADPTGGPSRLRFALRLAPGEHVVGLGERFHALDQRGRSVDTKVFEQYKGQGTRTYLPVPLALVVGGDRPWGFHVDTTRRCWFDVGDTDPDLLWIDVACDPSEDAATVRVELIEAATPAEVLAALWSAVGPPVPAPAWVLRPWMSGNEWNTQARVEQEVGRTLEEGIPAGVLVIEAWADEATFTAFRDARYEPHDDGRPHRLSDFTFPEDGAWPDPAGMVDRLHEHDVKVLLWQIPVLPEGPDVVQLDHDRRVLVDRGFAVREEDGSPYRNRGWWFPRGLLPDFTSEEATRWWIDKRRYLLEDLGVDGFKTDGGEHAWGDELRYADGTRGDVTNDRFPNLYAQAYHRLLRESGVEGVTFSRAGSAGAGAFPCHWAGDEDSTWDAYRAAIVAGLTAGVSGIVYWGWDHGGFSGEVPDAELYLRTAAQACFCPIMQYHAEFNDHREPNRDRTPWNIADRTGDDRVVPIYRRFAVLRDRLVAELDAQLRVGIGRGLPLMRALGLVWPDDQEVWRYPSQYLLGDDLLVAPVTDPGATRWSLYVPGGRWVDPWDRSVVRGPTVLEVDAPLDRIPVLVREEAADRLLPLFDDLPGPGGP